MNLRVTSLLTGATIEQVEVATLEWSGVVHRI